MDTLPVSLQVNKVTTKQIHETLLKIGIPPNLYGYSYILYSIELILENPEYMYRITKGLYIDVAIHFNSSPARVERAIRNAINAAWLRGDYDYISHIFYNCVNSQRGVPSNSLFLSRLYHYFITQDYE